MTLSAGQIIIDVAYFKHVIWQSIGLRGTELCVL